MNSFKSMWFKCDFALFKLVRFLIFIFTTAMVVVSTAQVLMRYFLNFPIRWGNEFCCFMLVYDVFLGAALGLRQGGHVRLEIEKIPMPKNLYKIFSWLSSAAVYIFVGIYLYFGTKFAMLNGGSVTEVMKWPYIVLYCVLPVSGVLMLIGQTTALMEKADMKKEAKA